MFWLLVPFLMQAFGKTVLLQCPDCSDVEYKAMLKAHSAMISPVQEYLESHPSSAHRERLLALFSSAQKEFLNKSNEEASVRFEEIVKMIALDDWERSDREVFLQSFLRLAQMEPSAEKRDSWLGRSLALGDVKPDAELFPPPLLSRRAEIQAHAAKRNLSKRLLARGWEEVLVDGFACAKDGCELWPLYPGEVRVTVLSNRWAPQTKILNAADVDRFMPVNETWVKGGCGTTETSEQAREFGDAQIFRGLNCRKTTGTAVDPKPVTEPLPLFTSPEPAKPRSVLRSPWLWGGVAAVVVTAVVLANSKTHETTQPTTTYGY